MGKRRKGRILAFQALFAWDVQYKLSPADKKDQVLADLLDFSWNEKKPPSQKLSTASLKQDEDENEELIENQAKAFPRLLAAGTVENIKTVDSMIRRHLQNWDFSRLNSVDRALLRLSVYELMFQTAPPTVVIDEAIDISREYGTDDSYRFINGVLDGVRKTIQNENSSTAKPI
jgi:N utilization substance protein B